MKSSSQNTAQWSDLMALDFGLKAQSRLLPYALGFFGIGLPIFLWTALYALPVTVIGIILVVLAINWALLFWLRARVERQLREEGQDGPSSRQVSDRLWRQGLAGGLWAVSLLCISLVTALYGGEHAEFVLMICAAGAASLIFFMSPVLLFLLVVGPIAIVGPVMGLRMLPLEWDMATLTNGGLFLFWAMGFVLNRHLREHYRLEYGRTVLAQDREVALDAARHAAEARTALMEVLSREVQSGLRAVANDLVRGSELLSRAPAPRQHLHAALDEVRHLQSLLVTTLDNDTAASGQLSVTREPVDLVALAGACAQDAQDWLQSKGLSFALTVTAHLQAGAAMGDPTRVRQVLEQLLDNAIAYTAAGKVEIRIMAPADGMIRIEVLDSGPGLSGDELAEAFRPHGRVARTCAGTSGAGLGLSLSQALAKLMGGRVGGESTLDVGSKFWLDLPWDAQAVLAPRPMTSASEAEEADTTSMRVLLVAHDSLRAAQLRDVLETLGHRCLTSTSAERALRLARKAPVDACLLTAETLGPEADALESFADALGQIQPQAAAHLIALLSDGEQAEALRQLGIIPLLAPLSREAIGRALAR